MGMAAFFVRINDVQWPLKGRITVKVRMAASLLPPVILHVLDSLQQIGKVPS